MQLNSKLVAEQKNRTAGSFEKTIDTLLTSINKPELLEKTLLSILNCNTLDHSNKKFLGWSNKKISEKNKNQIYALLEQAFDRLNNRTELENAYMIFKSLSLASFRDKLLSHKNIKNYPLAKKTLENKDIFWLIELIEAYLIKEQGFTLRKNNKGIIVDWQLPGTKKQKAVFQELIDFSVGHNTTATNNYQLKTETIASMFARKIRPAIVFNMLV